MSSNGLLMSYKWSPTKEFKLLSVRAIRIMELSNINIG